MHEALPRDSGRAPFTRQPIASPSRSHSPQYNLLEPEGLKAISRRLSSKATVPPDQRPQPIRIPEGSQPVPAAIPPGSFSRSAPYQGIASLNPWLMVGIPPGCWHSTPTTRPPRIYDPLSALSVPCGDPFACSHQPKAQLGIRFTCRTEKSFRLILPKNRIQRVIQSSKQFHATALASF